jgi:hypothetical protein
VCGSRRISSGSAARPAEYGAVWVGIAVWLLLTAAVAASDEPPVLEITVPPGAVSVGDRVPVRVTARGGEELMWGELRIGSESEKSWAVVEGPRELAGARPPVWELTLAPMEVGEIAVPAIGAVVRDPGGDPREVTATDLPTVNVASVLPVDEDVQPEPLRGPIGVSGFPWEWVGPLAVPVLGLAAVLAWWGRRRRRFGEGASVSLVAPIDELEAALARLRGRVGREPSEGVCDRLASGLRHYLERRTDQPAEEMTSFELRLLARKLGWPETIQRGIQAVMGTADRVRFGRKAADDVEIGRAIDLALEIALALEEHLRPEMDESELEEAAG